MNSDEMNAGTPAYLKGLNAAQREAVEMTEGPLLILAGAGAGKTKTITHRILHLIKKGVAPNEILAITFTNKAAKEMRDRVMKLLDNDRDLNLPLSQTSTYNNRPFISTFHSLGVLIIKEFGGMMEIPRHFAIYDRSDSKQAMKDAIIAAGHDPKKIEPGKVLSIISRAKGDFISQTEYEAKNGDDYMGGVVAEVWQIYDGILKKDKALDFDDLLFKATMLLRGNEQVRQHYQRKWKYLSIDEYQDTNEVQYTLARLLVGETHNIVVVGDSDQCITGNTNLRTQKGLVKASDVRKGMKIMSATGAGGQDYFSVDKIIKNKFKGNIIEVKTRSGKKLTLTPNHIVFAKLGYSIGIYYVYLMYKRSHGFRVGVVKGTRKSKGNEEEIGLIVRSNQEFADRMWILKVCNTREDASYFENYYSYKYGILTVVFHAAGRKISMRQSSIDKLFKEIDTRKCATKLFSDFNMSFEYPHYFPQGTTLGNDQKGRMNLRITMFSDKRKSLIRPWGLSRVSINTTNKELKEKLEHEGFNTRKGKRNDWRLEMANLDYAKCEDIVSRISTIDKEMTTIKSALLTDNGRMLFQPAANLHPTMMVAVNNKGVIVDDEIISIEYKEYSGNVYDFNIGKVHNYIANDIVLHNCIYSWRGANIKNILRFEEDYPSSKTILLTENYRSTQTILAAANSVIAKNIYRKEKNLFTKNDEGEKIELYSAYDEGDEASHIGNSVRDLIRAGTNAEEIAVLYRANFQSRALEEAFLTKSIPYQLLGTKFFERREVKDVLSYARAALNPDSMADIKRIINTPTRGIGKVSLLKVLEGKVHELPAGTQLKINDFKRILASIKKKIEESVPSVAIKYILTVSGIEKMLEEGKEADDERLENVRELVTLATKYDMTVSEDNVPTAGMEKLLEEAALASDQDTLEKNEPAVKLMTVHAAKGLEFDHVFISGLEQELFPHVRGNEESLSPEEREEERRLFYVALTRARKKLFLSYANVRTIFGSKQVNLPSEFLADIDTEHMAEQERVTGIKSIFIDF